MPSMMDIGFISSTTDSGIPVKGHGFAYGLGIGSTWENANCVVIKALDVKRVQDLILF